MSLISKDHFNMALKGVKRLVDQVSKNIVQSDWNETDETSKAYIQNKPFEEKGTEYTFVDLKDAPISGQGAAVLSSTCEYELIPGNIYKVIIDGVEKEVECVVLPAYTNRRYLMLGANSTQNNNSIYQWTPDKSYIYAFTTWNSGTSVKVIGRTQPPKKLSEQYIPDTIARVSDVDEIKGEVFCGSCDTGSRAPAKVVTVSDSSFVLKSGVMIYVHFTNANTSSSTLTLNVNSTGAKQIKLANSVYCGWGPGSYITFLYDGTYWQMISLSPGEASTNYYGITKLSSSISSTSTSIAATPSAVKQAYDLASKALPKSGGSLTGNLTLAANPTSNLHAVTKQYVDNAVKNVDIPEQVQTDWNQNNPDALDYVKNRTHYKIGGEVVVDEQTLITVAQTDTGSIDFEGKIPAVKSPLEGCFIGELYDVYFNGILYVCPVRYDGIIGNYLGNKTLCAIAKDGDNTGEPFLFNTYAHNGGLSVWTPEPMEFTLKVIRHKILHPIDEEFIPDTIARKTDIPEQVQADWNQNNPDQSDYIENRPCYTKDPVPTEIFSRTGDQSEFYDAIENYGYVSLGISDISFPPIIVGNTYSVTIDGITHEVIAKNTSGLGNQSIIKKTVEDTGESFYIMRASAMFAQLYLKVSEIPSSVSFSVSTYTLEVVQLDEKYISYKPGRLIKAGDIYEYMQPDGTQASIAAEGNGVAFIDKFNIATGQYSVSEGRYTVAHGSLSHAEGEETRAYGRASHTEGFCTVANSRYQHVSGQFNEIDSDNKYVHIVGNGTREKRANIHTLDWNGNAFYAGSVEVPSIILKSSTENSTKKFKLTIGDDGVLITTEIIDEM